VEGAWAPEGDALRATGRRRRVINRAVIAIGASLALSAIGWYVIGGKVLSSSTTAATWDGAVSGVDGCWSAPSLSAFGHEWIGAVPLPAGAPYPVPLKVPGTFHQLNATQGIFVPSGAGEEFQFRRGPGSMECSLEPWWKRFQPADPGVLSIGSQPNPCRLLTTEELTAAMGTIVDEPTEPVPPSESEGGRACVWNVPGSTFSRDVTLYILNAQALAAARARDEKTSPPSTWLAISLYSVFAGGTPSPYVDLRIEDCPARYWHAVGQAMLRVLSPTAFIDLVVGGNGLPYDQATLSKLATLAVRRIPSTGP
jgi:hypothetical protein